MAITPEQAATIRQKILISQFNVGSLLYGAQLELAVTNGKVNDVTLIDDAKDRSQGSTIVQVLFTPNQTGKIVPMLVDGEANQFSKIEKANILSAIARALYPNKI